MEETTKSTILQRPRICCFDLTKSDEYSLELNGYNVFHGSLGSVMKIPNKSRGDYSNVLLDYNFPDNFQEYDILIVDLTNENKKEYKAKEHEVVDTRRNSILHLICSYPTTIFDPRPLACSYLGQLVREIKSRKFLQIIFSCESYEFEYEKVQITNNYFEKLPSETHNIYSFLYNVGLSQKRHGKEIEICAIREDLSAVLNKYKADLVYEQTFYHPSIWTGESNIDDPNFIPLIKNINNEIVSFFNVEENLFTFILPNIKDKAGLLNELLKNIFPSILPDLFPFSTQFKWKELPEYFLPNHLKLLNEKNEIKLEFENKNEEIDLKIADNITKFHFLHDLVIGTGGVLVHAVHKFLMWLEFEKVTIKDEDSKSILEEDIQVEHKNGLLIIETKGIGGTSTDNDCSQIAKIKLRRCRERNAFDVSALYIVNHQRYLPPLKRKNPPFTENQISDAVNDERGLLTTWQLYNLYFDVQNNLIEKGDARNELLKYGLVEFRPKTKFKLPIIKQILKEGYIIILEISEIKLMVGQNLLAEKNGKYFRTKIVSIELNDQPVNEVENGEVGLKLDAKIYNGTTLWVE